MKINANELVMLSVTDSQKEITRGLTAYIAPLRFYRSLQIK